MVQQKKVFNAHLNCAIPDLEESRPLEVRSIHPRFHACVSEAILCPGFDLLLDRRV